MSLGPRDPAPRKSPVAVSVFSLQLAGTLLLAAHAHLRSLLLCSPAPASGTFADAFPRLLPRLPGGGHGGALPGPSEAGGRTAALLCVTLLAGVSALWSGMVGVHPACRPDLVAATP